MFGSKINPSDAKADLGDDIANSAVFDDGSSQYFSRAFTGADSLKTFCIHVIFKRGNHGLTDTILVDTGTTGTKNRLSLSIDPLDRLVFIWGTQILITTNKLRDPGWYHVTLRCDSTQATAADRASIEINNVEATYTTDNRAASMAQNSEAAWGESGATGYIGAYSTPSNYWDGYMALHYYIDGDDSVVFGRYSTTHTTVWVYAAPSPTYGTDGHKLAFETGGNLGDDTSGNTNDWTNNGGVTQSTDTPTNVFATLNPLDKGSSTALANGGLQQAAGTDHIVRSTLPIPSTGKWAISGKVDVADFSFGVCTPEHSLTSKVGRSNFSWGAIDSPGASFFQSEHDSVGTNSTVPSATNDTFVIAYDADAMKLWLGRNDGGAGIAYLGGGDPAAGTSPTYTLTSGDLNGKELFFAVGNRLSVSFGQVAHYETLPTGFNELCQANLPVLADIGGIDKPWEHIVASVDTEANIVSTLAAALAPASYVDILKNLDATENWAWRFSYDSSNEYSVDATPTYGAARALSGSNNWLGIRIATGSASGNASGSQAHTNGGGNTTVTHSLGDATQVILLLPRAGGDIYMHHPALTSGSLIKLNSTAAQAASTRITNIGANSFDIASAAPSDTYDYLVLTEVAGLCSFPSYDGNSAPDGPFVHTEHQPLWFVVKNIDAVGNFYEWDTARKSDNPHSEGTQMNTDVDPGPATTFASGGLDFTASGLKHRQSSGDMNTSAQTYAVISFANAAIGGGIPFPNAR